MLADRQDLTHCTAPCTFLAVGKKQRHSEFIGLTDEEVSSLARDPRQPKQVRRKATAEEKFRRQRNRRKER